MVPSLIGAAAALLSAWAWALGSLLFRRIGERAAPSAMNLAKSSLGLVLLGVAALVSGGTLPGPAAALRLAASGVLGIAVGDTLFFMALVRLNPRVTLLLATVGHVFTVLGAALILGERPTPAAWVGIALVLTGVGVVLQEGAPTDAHNGAPEGATAGAPTDRLAGIGYGVLSAVVTSAGLLLAKTGVADADTLPATWLRLAAGVAALLLWGAVRGTLPDDLRAVRQPGLLRELLVAVAVVIFGGFWLSVVSLRYTDAAIATALAAMEPVFVLPLAWWWLGERVSVRAIVAAVVATVGVGLIVGG